MSSVRRKVARVAYYARNIALDALPQAYFRRQLMDLLRARGRQSEETLRSRVNYYNKLDETFRPSAGAPKVGAIPVLGSSTYGYDLKEYARYFDPRFAIEYLFGDVVKVPPRPTLVKSRPIAGDNRNAVLMKLNKFRHFHAVRDPVPFERKRPVAVWRGGVNHPRRMVFVAGGAGLPGCDIGFTTHDAPPEYLRSRMTIQEQLRHRYVISVEGNDVATNLKWIFASNSLCVMPAPSCETWFMEGRLEAGVHYAAVRPDASDLVETIEHFEARPAEARAIIRNAQEHSRLFLDSWEERLVSLLVLYKYFVLSGQIDPDREIWARIES